MDGGSAESGAVDASLIRQSFAQEVAKSGGLYIMTRLLLLVFAVLLGPAFSSAAAERPNILWIYLEDVSGWFSCYGDEVIDTPNIDALAKSGVRYDRFYTPAGVCSTTRSAIITGMMQTTIGAHEHRSCRPDLRGLSMGAEYDRNDLPEGMKTLPETFRDNGYWTFNEGGKDDYNFTYSVDEMYDATPGRGWGPTAFLAGKCLEGKPADEPFFGQIQLGGGKLGGRAVKTIDPAVVPVPPYYPDIPEVRTEIAHHYDCLLKTDEHVGQIIAKLKADGLYENTLIFVFSDHGYKLHRHKQFLYEGGIHMPLIVVGHGIEASSATDELVSGIDISAATLAASGIGVPDYMQGQDFLDPAHTSREFVLSARDRCDETIEEIRAVVTPQFKYLRNYMTDVGFMQGSYKDSWPVSKAFRKMMADGTMNETQKLFFRDDKEPEEFYDLSKDPHEINNLATDPDYQAELERHRAFLDGWTAEHGDKGIGVESNIGLLSTMKRWGNDKCSHPDYDRVRDQYLTWKAAQPVKPKKKKKR